MSNDLMQVITPSLLSCAGEGPAKGVNLQTVCEVWTFVFSNKKMERLAVKGALMFLVSIVSREEEKISI